MKSPFICEPTLSGVITTGVPTSEPDEPVILKIPTVTPVPATPSNVRGSPLSNAPSVVTVTVLLTIKSKPRLPRQFCKPPTGTKALLCRLHTSAHGARPADVHGDGSRRRRAGVHLRCPRIAAPSTTASALTNSDKLPGSGTEIRPALYAME
jgi:hypothetical protein